MSDRLRRFTAGEVILTGQDAHNVLRFFFTEPGITPEKLTIEDRAFAQALLVDAIDQSYDMGYAATLFNALGMKPIASLTGVAVALANLTARATAHWFKHASADDLKDPQIYENVRLWVKRNWATVWQFRIAGGPLSY
jgi:hypothetical protein